MRDLRPLVAFSSNTLQYTSWTNEFAQPIGALLSNLTRREPKVTNRKIGGLAQTDVTTPSTRK